MGDAAKFKSRLESTLRKVKESASGKAIILHHDEADGLTSAALAKLAFEKLGLETELICLDKLYPEVVANIERIPAQIVVYVDLGSGHIDLLTESNQARNTIVVLDHHDTKPSSNPLVLNLNPELDGFSGEKDASSATVAYTFAKTVDPELRRYSHLALIGSLEIPGDIQGLNLPVAKEAEEMGLIRKTDKGDYRIESETNSISRTKAVTVLNVLGSVGYYHDGPKMGIRACIHGFDPKTLKVADGLENQRKEANKRMLETIRNGGLSQMKMVQWFHAGDNYEGMSGKVVGSFCSYLRFQRGINPVKYLIGMMYIPPDIPGWGRLPAALVKVSGRAPEPLVKLIAKGTRPALSKILPESCSSAGGFGDGHSVAASGVFPIGGERRFLQHLDRIASTESPEQS